VRLPGWLAAGAASLAMALALRVLTPVQTVGYDGAFYRAMTESPWGGADRTLTAPYAFRIFPAWVLHFVPGPALGVYTVYTVGAETAAAALLFAFLRARGLGPGAAGFGTGLFLTSWVNLRFALYNPIHIDATYYLAVAGAFWAMARKRDGWFLVFLLAGALSREYFVALLGAWYFFRKTPGKLVDGPILLRGLALGALPVAAAVALRALIPAVNRGFDYAGHAVYFGRLFFLYWPRMVHAAFNVFGVGLFLVILDPRGAGRCLAANPGAALYLGACVLFTAVGGADRCRILFTAFPAVVLLAAQAVERRRAIYLRPGFLVFAAAVQLFLMRAYLPITPANYRLHWWSTVSFRPEALLRQSWNRILLCGAAFSLVAAGSALAASSAPGGRSRRGGGVPAKC